LTLTYYYYYAIELDTDRIGQVSKLDLSF